MDFSAVMDSHPIVKVPVWEVDGGRAHSGC